MFVFIYTFITSYRCGHVATLVNKDKSPREKTAAGPSCHIKAGAVHTCPCPRGDQRQFRRSAAVWPLGVAVPSHRRAHRGAGEEEEKGGT